MLRVVLDTNVIVSVLIQPAGIEASVLQLVLRGWVQLVVSDDVLAEYRGVLQREKFAKLAQPARATLAALRDVGESVTPVSRLSVASDEDDNRFLECADAGKANYLVTGNKKHYPASFRNIQIVNARGFLELVHPR